MPNDSPSLLSRPLAYTSQPQKPGITLHLVSKSVGRANAAFGAISREESFGQRPRFGRPGGNLSLWGPERFFSVTAGAQGPCVLSERAKIAAKTKIFLDGWAIYLVNIEVSEVCGFAHFVGRRICCNLSKRSEQPGKKRRGCWNSALRRYSSCPVQFIIHF